MYSPFDIATVCNRFLRQVPNQLFQNFDAWMAATAKYDKENPDPSIDSIKKLLESIHPMEKRLIRGLFALLKKISDNQDHTKMGISNLQTVFYMKYYNCCNSRLKIKMRPPICFL